MTIEAVCPCGAKFKAKDELAGKRVKCPKCKQPFVVGGQAAKKKPAASSQPAKKTARPQPRQPAQTPQQLVATCAGCGGQFAAQPQQAGQQFPCPNCQNTVIVPGGESPLQPIQQPVQPASPAVANNPSSDPLGAADPFSDLASFENQQPAPGLSGVGNPGLSGVGNPALSGIGSPALSGVGTASTGKKKGGKKGKLMMILGGFGIVGLLSMCICCGGIGFMNTIHAGPMIGGVWLEKGNIKAWETYTPKNGRFSVSMPDGHAKENTPFGFGFGRSETTMVGANLEKRGNFVVVSSAISDDDEAKIEKEMEEFESRIIKDDGILFERDMFSTARFAKEVYSISMGHPVAVRMYVTDKYVYMAAWQGERGTSHNTDCKKFLSSLTW